MPHLTDLPSNPQKSSLQSSPQRISLENLNRLDQFSPRDDRNSREQNLNSLPGGGGIRTSFSMLCKTQPCAYRLWQYFGGRNICDHCDPLNDYHMDTETQHWICMYQNCHGVFSTKEIIDSHVRMHRSWVRAYKCDVCGRSFMRQQQHQRHARLHRVDRPHKCPCDKSFLRSEVLRRHRRRGMCVGAFADAGRLERSSSLGSLTKQ